MGFIRDRLVGVSMLVVSIHLAACGLAISAACDMRDDHQRASSSHECHMPAEQAHACPLHHASSTEPSNDGTQAPSLPSGPSLRCNCGASFSLDALLGTPFVLRSANMAGGALAAAGVIAVFVPATLDEPSQVSSPPPRA